MMKNFVLKLSGIVFFFSLTLNTMSQVDSTTVNKLNKILESSLYKTSIKINSKKDVFRSDSNGNTFEYNLNDIEKINYADDGHHNAIIIFRVGKKAKGVVAGRNIDAEINVIPFELKSDCDKAIELFNTLIKSK